MKQGQLTTKGINRIKISGGEISGDVDSSDDSSINNKPIKYLSSSFFHIYDDTFKYIIHNSDIQKFSIHENKEKSYIFVSFSNSNIELYDK